MGFVFTPPSHLAVSGTEGVSVHRIPMPINKVDGHGRCGTVGVEGGVRGCIGGGVRQGGGAQRGFGGNEGGGGRPIPDTNSTHASDEAPPLPHLIRGSELSNSQSPVYPRSRAPVLCTVVCCILLRTSHFEQVFPSQPTALQGTHKLRTDFYSTARARHQQSLHGDLGVVMLNWPPPVPPPQGHQHPHVC